MQAEPAYDADGQGVRLYLSEEEADAFCKEIGGRDDLWQQPQMTVAENAALTVRLALKKWTNHPAST